VYHELKQFGSSPASLTSDLDMTQFETRARDLLDQVYSVYGQFSAAALRNTTHQEPPWRQTPQGAIISHDLMREFFKTRLADED